MPPIYPDVNGARTSYCSIEFAVDGIPIVGVKEISYKETLETQKIWGTTPKPIGRTRGKVDFEGSVTLYQAEWLALMQRLSGGGAFGFSETSHVISVAYAEETNPTDTVLDTLTGVRFHSPEAAHSESADALMVTVQMSIMDITWGAFSGLRSLPAS